MKLSISERDSGKKSNAKKTRRNGQIPAVLYGAGQASQNICFQLDEMQAALRSIQPGLLPTTVFELHEGGSFKQKAVVKDIQYHPTSYAILHMDFFAVSDEANLTVNVPVRLEGVAECAGVKMGGFIRQVVRFLKVTCKLKDKPMHFTLDVKDLMIGQSLRLSDIPMPEGVSALGKMQEVAVIVTKRA